MNRDQIRDIFLRNGFTIKDGQTDLKPYVYAAAVDLISEAESEWISAGHESVAKLVEALEQIERWDGFPSTGETWEGSDRPVSFAAMYGSNGERDFMRSVAGKALAAYRNQEPSHDNQ